MRKVFEVELASENGCTQMTFPAAPYAMLDALERLRLESGETPRWELLNSFEVGRIFQHLDQADGSLNELNALAQRFARLNESELTIVEGLAAMEHRPLGEPFPLSRMIDLAYSTDCCYFVEGVVTDAQLGRFCAENGFVPEADGLSDKAFELLNFEQIGKQFREAEGGVFTRQGYVQRNDELKQVYRTLDLAPKKPDYTILVQTASGCEVKLPFPANEPMGTEQVRCVDCAAPALAGITGGMEHMDLLARYLSGMEEAGTLTKFKAITEATGCDEVRWALSLADGLDQYTFSPKLLEPEDVAFECLRTMLPGNEVKLLTPYLDLPRYGQAVLDQTDGLLTSHGLIQRADNQPIQGMNQEQSQAAGMDLV